MKVSFKTLKRSITIALSIPLTLLLHLLYYVIIFPYKVYFLTQKTPAGPEKPGSSWIDHTEADTAIEALRRQF